MNSNNRTFIYAIKSLYFFASGQLSITEIKQSDMMTCDPPPKNICSVIYLMLSHCKVARQWVFSILADFIFPLQQVHLLSSLLIEAI